MSKIREVLNLHADKTNSDAVRITDLNYHDTTIGLRSPSYPSGTMVDETGNVFMYSGRSLIAANYPGNITLSADEGYFKFGSLDLSVPVDGFKINSKHLNEDIYLGKQKLLTTESSLEGLYVLNDNSRIDADGKVINKTPLKSFLETKELFLLSEDDFNLDIYAANTVANLLGRKLLG